MSLNPLREVRYRFRLAKEHAERAGRLSELGDWVGVINSAQLAVENFAKALIAVFEVPTWSRDPSNQLLRLHRLPLGIRGDAEELARLARDMAPERGRSTYGEPGRGLTPSDLYEERHARDALDKAFRAEEAARKAFKVLNVDVESISQPPCPKALERAHYPTG